MKWFLVKMAGLNLFRHRRRTFITLGGIVAGTACAFLFAGFVRHAFWGMSEHFARSGNGHIQIARGEWFSSSRPETFRTPIADLEKVKAALLGNPEIKKDLLALSIRRNISGIVSTGERSEVFLGQGDDPIAHQLLSTWVEVVAGQPLEPDRPQEVLLGKTLADKIGARPGDNASLLLSTDDGRTNAVDVQVAGLLQYDSRDLDGISLVLPLRTAMSLANAKTADVLVMALRHTAQTDRVLELVRKQLSDLGAGDLQARGWSELAEYYQSVKTLYTRLFGFAGITLFLVTLLLVMNTILMSVAERTQEISTLRAVGMRQGEVKTQFLFEGLFLGTLGAGLGLLTAGLIALGVLVTGGIPMPPPPGSLHGYPLFFNLNWSDALAIFLVTVVSTVIAALLPARKASLAGIAATLRGLAVLLTFSTLMGMPRTSHAAPPPPNPEARLQAVDELRRVPVDGFELETQFVNLGPDGKPSGEPIVARVVGAGSKAIAVLMSDPPGDRMSILSIGNGMWMQKENMRKAIRISPAQRLVGQASNADVISVQFSTDYQATALSRQPKGTWLLTLAPRPDSQVAAYGKIELELAADSAKIQRGLFYALSGKLLKTTHYHYEPGPKGDRLAETVIADAIRTDLQTKVTIGAATAHAGADTFFNPESLLNSVRRIIQ